MAPSRAPSRRRIVTISSDLGAAYAAQMKAVLLGALAPGRVVELSHDLPAHGIAEAAFVVRAMARGFPGGTIHLVVVDPGVGGRRAAVAIECRDGSVLVGPDNGVLVPLSEALGLGRAYRIDPRRWSRPGRVGTTFDGRDLFAPVAVTLALGTPVQRLGAPTALKGSALPVPRREGDRLHGSVVHVDHFGNLITNIPTGWVPSGVGELRARVGSKTHAVPWVRSYEAIGRGRLGALGSSFGTVELALDRGRAERRLGQRAGAAVSLAPARPRLRGRQSVNSDRPRRR